ncbi:MAG TPA: hypothetical protein QF753_08605 [Victivallales bacterium]|nr:hypothetical protein [Victivallales bacterium]
MKQLFFLFILFIFSFSTIVSANETLPTNTLTDSNLSPNEKLSPDALKKEQAPGYKLMPAMTDSSTLVAKSLQKLMKSDYSSKREQFKKYQDYSDAIYTKNNKLFSINVSYDGAKYTLTLDEYNFESKQWKIVVKTKDLTKINYTVGIGWNVTPVLEDNGYIFITGTHGILIYNSNSGKTSIASSEYRCYPKITSDHKLLIVQSNGNVILYDYLNAKLL